jgi:hypothetical protein
LIFQLAILASYSGNEVVAVYRYFRSLAADTPFATARDNLIILFEKVLLYSLACIGTAVSSCFLIVVRFFFLSTLELSEYFILYMFTWLGIFRRDATFPFSVFHISIFCNTSLS